MSAAVKASSPDFAGSEEEPGAAPAGAECGPGTVEVEADGRRTASTVGPTISSTHLPTRSRRTRPSIFCLIAGFTAPPAADDAAAGGSSRASMGSKRALPSRKREAAGWAEVGGKREVREVNVRCSFGLLWDAPGCLLLVFADAGVGGGMGMGQAKGMPEASGAMGVCERWCWRRRAGRA